jgi:cell wall-associated NlpC family hydrolase
VTLSALPVPGALPSTLLASDVFAQASAAVSMLSREEAWKSLAGEKPQQAASARELVNTARGYAGVRYRWAGMTSRGMDCSGLIARVLKANGIRAPHRAADLFQLGQRVHFVDLQPGDLLFFKTSPRGISHVGMYVGDHEFIHASSGAGRVITTSLCDPYYSKRLKGARRLGKTP